MPKKRLTNLLLDFVSAVDRPAQEPATVAILKRKGATVDKPKTEDQIAYIKRLLDEGFIPETAKDSAVKKATVLTTEMGGHTHLIHTGRYDGGEDKAGSTSWTDEHNHPWIYNSDGDIVIGAADGHTHEVAIMTKEAPTAKEAGPMTTKKEEKSPEVVALEKQLAEARALAELSDTHKAHYATLKGAAKPAFLKKSADERDADVQAVKLADDIVFKAADGTEYRKSDDPRLVKMARQGDEDRATLAKERDARRTAEYAKRAGEDFGHLTGEADTKVALLKAVDEITDEEVRGKVTELLKSTDNGIAEALRTRGTKGGTQAADGDAHAKLEGLAREHAKTANVSFEKAYNAVLDTPEGKALYAQHVEANPAS